MFHNRAIHRMSVRFRFAVRLLLVERERVCRTPEKSSMAVNRGRVISRAGESERNEAPKGKSEEVRR
jgi:hypothetical protein